MLTITASKFPLHLSIHRIRQGKDRCRLVTVPFLRSQSTSVSVLNRLRLESPEGACTLKCHIDSIDGRDDHDDHDGGDRIVLKD